MSRAGDGRGEWGDVNCGTLEACLRLFAVVYGCCRWLTVVSRGSGGEEAEAEVGLTVVGDRAVHEMANERGVCCPKDKKDGKDGRDTAWHDGWMFWCCSCVNPALAVVSAAGLGQALQTIANHGQRFDRWLSLAPEALGRRSMSRRKRRIDGCLGVALVDFLNGPLGVFGDEGVFVLGGLL